LTRRKLYAEIWDTGFCSSLLNRAHIVFRRQLPSSLRQIASVCPRLGTISFSPGKTRLVLRSWAGCNFSRAALIRARRTPPRHYRTRSARRPLPVPFWVRLCRLRLFSPVRSCEIIPASAVCSSDGSPPSESSTRLPQLGSLRLLFGRLFFLSMVMLLIRFVAVTPWVPRHCAFRGA